MTQIDNIHKEQKINANDQSFLSHFDNTRSNKHSDLLSNSWVSHVLGDAGWIGVHVLENLLDGRICNNSLDLRIFQSSLSLLGILRTSHDLHVWKRVELEILR